MKLTISRENRTRVRDTPRHVAVAGESRGRSGTRRRRAPTAATRPRCSPRGRRIPDRRTTAHHVAERLAEPTRGEQEHAGLRASAAVDPALAADDQARQEPAGPLDRPRHELREEADVEREVEQRAARRGAASGGRRRSCRPGSGRCRTRCPPGARSEAGAAATTRRRASGRCRWPSRPSRSQVLEEPEQTQVDAAAQRSRGSAGPVGRCGCVTASRTRDEVVGQRR